LRIIKEILLLKDGFSDISLIYKAGSFFWQYPENVDHCEDYQNRGKEDMACSDPLNYKPFKEI